MSREELPNRPPASTFLTIVHVDIVYTTDGSSVSALHVPDTTKMVTEMMCRIRLANHVQGFHVDYMFGQVLAPVGHRHGSCFGGTLQQFGQKFVQSQRFTPSLLDERAHYVIQDGSRGEYILRRHPTDGSKVVFERFRSFDQDGPHQRIKQHSTAEYVFVGKPADDYGNGHVITHRSATKVSRE